MMLFVLMTPTINNEFLPWRAPRLARPEYLVVPLPLARAETALKCIFVNPKMVIVQVLENAPTIVIGKLK